MAAKRTQDDDPAIDNTGEGALIPTRSTDDWTAEELDLAARSLSYADLDGEVKGKRAVTDDGREWKMAPTTTRCNTDQEVIVRPPWSDEWVTATPLYMRYQWTPSNGRHIHATPGPREGCPMVVVTKRLTTGAGDRGHRVVYAGPYTGKWELLPVSMED